MQDILLENLGAVECESGNVEAWWNNIQKCVLDTMRDLVRKVDRKARKPQIAQEMINKMDEQKKWKINNNEGRKNYRRLRNELLRDTNKANKELLEIIYAKITEYKRTGRYDSVHKKVKKLDWKEISEIQNIDIADSQENIIIDQWQVLKIWENYISEL